MSPREPKPGGVMIGWATVLLFVLAAGLLTVSIAAQITYIQHERHQHFPSIIEATALDVGMMIFSLLALGLSRSGQSARIERALVGVCAAGSAVMNYAASDIHSPRSVLAFVMPPVALAVVTDRVIAVVRRHVLGDDEKGAWNVLGKFSLYLLRLVLAPFSTMGGARRALLLATPLPEKLRIGATLQAWDDDDLPPYEPLRPLDALTAATRPPVTAYTSVVPEPVSGVLPADEQPRSRSWSRERRAKAIIKNNPGITGEELGERLGVRARQGQRIKAQVSTGAL